MFKDVNLSHREFPIENIEKLAFNTADVASSECTRTQGPVAVLNRPIVNVLRIPRDESAVNVARLL